MKNGVDLFDESSLRSSLRLEADEVPPRLDPALIAAAVRATGREKPDLMPVAAVAFVGGWVASQVAGLALAAAGTLIGREGLAIVIDALTVAAVVAAPVGAIVANAALPFLAASAALVFIALDQRRVRA